MTKCIYRTCVTTVKSYCNWTCRVAVFAQTWCCDVHRFAGKLAHPRHDPTHTQHPSSLCAGAMVCRKPLLSREVTIIRRLKRITELPPSKIAQAVGRSRTTVYEALDRTWAPGKRGQPPALSCKDVANLQRILKTLIRRARACWASRGRGGRAMGRDLAHAYFETLLRFLCTYLTLNRHLIDIHLTSN